MLVLKLKIRINSPRDLVFFKQVKQINNVGVYVGIISFTCFYKGIHYTSLDKPFYKKIIDFKKNYELIL